MGIVLSLVLLGLGAFILSPQGARLAERTNQAPPASTRPGGVAPATLPVRVFIGALLVIAGLMTLLTAIG